MFEFQKEHNQQFSDMVPTEAYAETEVSLQFIGYLKASRSCRKKI